MDRGAGFEGFAPGYAEIRRKIVDAMSMEERKLVMLVGRYELHAKIAAFAENGEPFAYAEEARRKARRELAEALLSYGRLFHWGTSTYQAVRVGIDGIDIEKNRAAMRIY